MCYHTPCMCVHGVEHKHVHIQYYHLYSLIIRTQHTPIIRWRFSNYLDQIRHSDDDDKTDRSMGGWSSSRVVVQLYNDPRERERDDGRFRSMDLLDRYGTAPASAGRSLTHSWSQLKANERPAGRHVALPAAALTWIWLLAALLYHHARIIYPLAVVGRRNSQ